MQSITRHGINHAFGQRQISTIYGQSNHTASFWKRSRAISSDPRFAEHSSTSRIQHFDPRATAPSNGRQYRQNGTTNTNNHGDAQTPSPARTGAAGGFCELCEHVGALVIAHQEQFPSVTISFDIDLGYALSDAVGDHYGGQRDIGMPPTVTGSYSGDRRSSPSRWRRGVAAAGRGHRHLHLLGVLYEASSIR